MPIISSSIPNMVNGVSQQPDTLRLSSQASLQENGFSTVSQGLKKRPPTRHVKRLSGPIVGSAYIHTINRDSNEQYEVIISGGDLKVYDLSGVEKTVNFPAGKGYLVSSDPASDFRAITVADYTFILNKKIIVQQSTERSTARPYEALVVVKSGQFGKNYTVSINGTVVATVTTPDGSLPEHAAQISTDVIAGSLATQISSSGTSATAYGSVVYLTKATEFTLGTTDGFNSAAMIGIKGKVQRFSDLPANGHVDGFAVQVAGDVNTDSDDYWVKFDSSGSTTGVWKETVKPNELVGFTAATMPMGLVREADGTFTLKVLSWDNRLVGDLESAPDPSFVGRPIRDIFFYRNRLGLLADEAVILSEAGEFFNFFPTTVTTLLDSDPIDVAASHTKVSILNYAVPFNKKLLLFSSQTQFAVEAGDLLTARTVSIKPTTEFECSDRVAPVGAGRNVYFAVPRGDFEGIREYFIATDTDTEDATDVTGHVPSYIPQGVYKIAAALNEDLLCLLTTAERNAIYIYKYFWNNNEKLQSSWSRWVFPETDAVLHAEFLQSNLFLVINRADGLYLERLNVAPGDFIEEEPYTVHLDRKVIIPASTETFDGTNTSITLEWQPTDGSYVAVVAKDQPKEAGTIIPVDVDGAGNASIKGDYSDCTLIVGKKYTFRYTFSKLMVRVREGQGQKADTVGRLQVRNMQINYAETGYFQVKVTPYGRNTYTYTYTGKSLGLPSATIGSVHLSEGQFKFPVQSQNSTVDIQLISDSPLPCAFMSTDWEGYYVRRSKAV